jgi:hypothetical protein
MTTFDAFLGKMSSEHNDFRSLTYSPNPLPLHSLILYLHRLLVTSTAQYGMKIILLHTVVDVKLNSLCYVVNIIAVNVVESIVMAVLLLVQLPSKKFMRRPVTMVAQR